MYQLDSEMQQLVQDSVSELVARWERIISKSSPEELAAEQQSSLEELALEAVLLILSTRDDAEAAFKLGAGLFNLTSSPAAMLDLQTALMAHIDDLLRERELGSDYAYYTRQTLNGMTLGFLTAKLDLAREFNIRSLRTLRHDLKTPINAITGFSKVILKGIDGPITDFQKEDLTAIFKAGRQLLEMIEDLTSVVIRDEEQTALELDSFDVAVLVGNILATAQPLLAEMEHTLTVQASGQLGEMIAPLSWLRWVILGGLLVLGRTADQVSLRLEVSRSTREGSDYLTYRMVGVDMAAQATLLEVEQALQLVPAQRYCRDMGGKLSTEADRGDFLIIAELPAVVDYTQL